MSVTETKEQKPLNEEIVRIAGVIKDKFSIDGKSGDITAETETPLYEAALPEDLPMKQVKQVHKYDRNFATAVTSVAGELSLQAMVDNKDLQETNVTIPLEGRSTYKGNFKRKVEFVNRIAAQHVADGKSTSTDPVVRHLHATVRIKTSMGGSFKVVKEQLAEKGKQFLAK